MPGDETDRTETTGNGQEKGSSAQDAGRPTHQKVDAAGDKGGSHIRWGMVALAALLVAIGVLVYQNIEAVSLRVFWWEFDISLVVIIVATALVTLVVEVLVKMVLMWRRRRMRHGRYPPRPYTDGRG